MSSFQPVAISLPRCTTTAPANSKPIPRKAVFGSTKIRLAFGQTGCFARGNLLHGQQGRDDFFHGQLGLQTLEYGDGSECSIDAAELANNLFS